MAQPDELETRVAALETEVRQLAGGAGRDVSEIRQEIRDFRQATTSSFKQHART